MDHLRAVHDRHITGLVTGRSQLTQVDPVGGHKSVVTKLVSILASVCTLGIYDWWFSTIHISWNETNFINNFFFSMLNWSFLSCFLFKKTYVIPFSLQRDFVLRRNKTWFFSTAKEKFIPFVFEGDFRFGEIGIHDFVSYNRVVFENFTYPHNWTDGCGLGLLLSAFVLSILCFQIDSVFRLFKM